eukprot:UN04131
MKRRSQPLIVLNLSAPSATGSLLMLSRTLYLKLVTNLIPLFKTTRHGLIVDGTPGSSEGLATVRSIDLIVVKESQLPCIWFFKLKFMIS